MRRPLAAVAAMALLPILPPGLAQAQPADARPAGGQVVAGQASISQDAARTQVNQASDRAVIEWRRFDVGAQHQVDIRQPSAASWSLQRVTGGDPSAIAGRVTSNGGVALVNPAGVMFSNGAQVDVASLIATTSDITNQNFMAGRMAFDGAPRPGARVENRGRITVAEQGLAALVGPVVANSGTIQARLGRVALAGGEAFALDLAGDGLLSLDVTRQVTQAGGAAALVTQSGTIEAAGGTVLLTASAASGVIETLVQAGGTTSAPTLGARAGTVALRAQGGDIRVTGRVRADGGSGTVEATGSGTVRIASGATVSASGGGGRVAVGAGAESRPGRPQRLAARTVVERGASVRADGGGGQVTIYAAQRTEMRGTVSATQGGDIEVSSRAALLLDGTMDAGATGRVLVDPATLRVVDSLSGSTEPAEITAAAVNATTGALTLQAESTIRVEAAIAKPSGPLTLETTNPTAAAGEGILLVRPVQVTGDLVLRSAGDITQAASGATLDVGTLDARSGGGAVRLEAGGNAIRALAGGSAAGRFGVASITAMGIDGAITAPEIGLATSGAIALRAPITTTGTLDLLARRGISQAASGAGITAGLLRLDSPLGPVGLTGAGNRITSLGDSGVAGGLSLVNAGALNIDGSLNGGRVSIFTLAGDLTQDPAASRIAASELQAVAEQGSVVFDSPLNSVAAVYGRARDGFLVDAGRAFLIAAPITATEVDLRAIGEIAQDSGAPVTAARLRLNATGGAITLDDPANQVAALGDAAAGGAFALSTGTALSIEGTVAAPSLTLTAMGDITAAGAGRIATPLLRITSRTGLVRLDLPGNTIDAVAASGAATDFTLLNEIALGVVGPLDATGLVRLSAQSLRLEAPVSAATAWFSANAGDVGQTATGTIGAARLLADSPGGNVRLTAAGNAFGTIGGGAMGDFAVAAAGNAAPDPLAGIVAPRIALTIGGSFVQDTAGAPILTERLEATAGGRIDLRAGANAIQELGAMTAPGGLALSTTTGLLLAVPLDLPALDLTAALGIRQLTGAPIAAREARFDGGTGDVLLEEGANALPLLRGGRAGGAFRLSTGGGIALAGPVTAGTVLAFQADGDITQAGIGAGLVAPLAQFGSISGSVALEGAGNRIVTLGTSFAAGGFALAQEGAAPLVLAGLLVAPEVTLRTESGVEDAAGAGLRAGLLRLDTTGAVRLDAAGQHFVDSVGGRSGALALAVEGALSVTEALAAGGLVALAAESLRLEAPVTATGAQFVARAGDVTQAATGAGLVLGATGLSVSASGAVALEGAGNAVTRLTAGSAGMSFALADAGALGVTGAVAGTDLVLRAAGRMTLDGATLRVDRAALLGVPAGLASGATSRLLPRDPALLPVLIVDTRLIGGLTAIPAGVAADLPGLPASLQPTQLAAFGPAASAPAGPAVFDLAIGASPLFLLLDAGSALGVVEAGRFGLLGQGGSAFILGTLGGTGGGAAAQGVAVAATQSGYLFNSCVMGSATCTPVAVTPDTPTPPVPETPVPETPVTEIPVTTPPALAGGSSATGDAPGGAVVPGIGTAPRLLAADLRAGSPDAPPAWEALWRQEED